MDHRGWERINNSLETAGIAASVSPEPKDREDLAWVTIETDPSTKPEEVLNALGNMVSRTGALAIGYAPPQGGGPRLDPKIGWPGSLTLADTNARIA